MRGFEPLSRQSRKPVFETGPFNHSGTSPAAFIFYQNLTILKLKQIVKNHYLR